VTTAQVEAWVSTRKGSIYEAARGINDSFADAALGRMMLHRRRAVAASILSGFFSRMGGGSAAYMSSACTPVAHVLDEVCGTLLDAGGEQSIAAKAGDLVASTCGASPPLLFERALLAESEGRLEDALADMKQVVAAYPGFVGGAIPAARMALVAGDAAETIRLLAPVEGEIAHTRDGAALLADAARAIGLHESASRYDLAALSCRGGYDSHGNDCVPINLRGKIADDDRMPQSLYLEGQVDGSVICNAGGIYYDVRPFVGHLLTAANRGRRVSLMRSFGPAASGRRERRVAEIFEMAEASLRLLLSARLPNAFSHLGHYSELARTRSRLIWTLLWQILLKVSNSAARLDLALVVFVYRLYRRLPRPVRMRANKVVQSLKEWLRPQLRNRFGRHLGPRGGWGLFLPVSSIAHVQLANVRYESGIAQIFGLGPHGNGNGSTPLAGAFLEERLVMTAESPPNEVALQMPAPGTLPPLAEKTLRLLISEADIGNAALPPS
jgi:hypothetical protein